MTKETPEFKSLDEEADFWDSHSVLEFLDGASVVELDAAKARERRAERLRRGLPLDKQPE